MPPFTDLLWLLGLGVFIGMLLAISLGGQGDDDDPGGHRTPDRSRGQADRPTRDAHERDRHR